MADSLLQAYQKSGGNGIPSTPGPMTYPVASGQTFKVGDFVYLNSSGELVIAAASGADVDISALRLAGRALMSATKALATSMRCPVEPIDNVVFVFPIYHGTAASATVATNEVDTPLTLPLRNQGGVWCLNKQGNGTDDAFVVLGIHPCNRAGEQYTVVYAKAMDAALLSKAS